MQISQVYILIEQCLERHLNDPCSPVRMPITTKSARLPRKAPGKCNKSKNKTK